MCKQKPSNHSTIQTKRKRGGQPGNKNARGNCGNRFARGKAGNRGGKGAPLGNQFARKLRTLADALFRDYANVPEARAWLAANETTLRGEKLKSDTVLNQAMHLGLPVDE